MKSQLYYEEADIGSFLGFFFSGHNDKPRKSYLKFFKLESIFSPSSLAEDKYKQFQLQIHV